MKFISLLFVISTIYYLLNRSRLLLKPNDRVYKSKYNVYSDFIYYIVDFFYFLWILIMIFINFKLSLLLIILLFLRWFILDPFKEKQDMTYIILKLMVLFSIFIS
jgi:hypothetical protein